MSRTQQHYAHIKPFEIWQRDTAHQSTMGHHGLATLRDTAVRGIRAAEPQGSVPSYPEHLNSSYNQHAPTYLKILPARKTQQQQSTPGPPSVPLP
ncbi:uncharacterized protein CLUP02_04171 [Colletotrichum lupini]|uniref:Uncharacterized protein n=1 Tax=Colletotrichum lupini TaxID=145971 RepID=A0A9Q8SJV0_9PEZI|nr:uncharacterized protein CLUP02_04171 [Colletotrichum lupini]UQC78694.1 hypothetical protein CLUP02_04171 [Colletotrichum lupini]